MKRRASSADSKKQCVRRGRSYEPMSSSEQTVLSSAVSGMSAVMATM